MGFVEYGLYDNEYYGTSYQSIADIKEKNLICLLKIHVFGADKLKKENKMECNYLFISTDKGSHTLKKRMIATNKWSTEQINRRLEAAEKEFDFLHQNPNFFDSVIF